MHDHILKPFDRDLATLKDRLLLMAGMVESHLSDVMRALAEQDLGAAERLVRSDKPVNLLEMACDELGIQMIARWQPAASDLRFVVAALKITTDLERMGDLAVNIAERAVELAAHPKLDPPIDFSPMGALVKEMLTRALDAFVRRDASAAETVLIEDDRVDAAFRELFAALIARMKRSPGDIERAVGLLSIARHLERIADHATNIAEQVIFVERGQDVRHKSSHD